MQGLSKRPTLEPAGLPDLNRMINLAELGETDGSDLEGATILQGFTANLSGNAIDAYAYAYAYVCAYAAETEAAVYDEGLSKDDPQMGRAGGPAGGMCYTHIDDMDGILEAIGSVHEEYVYLPFKKRLLPIYHVLLFQLVNEDIDGSTDDQPRTD